MKKTTKIFGLLLTLFGLALVTGCTPITDTPEVPEETTYTVTIASGITNGTVSANKTSKITEGETITLTVTPENGYELDTLSVKNGGTEITVIQDLSDVTKYTFTMPAGNVTVSATFKEITYTVTYAAYTENGVVISSESITNVKPGTKLDKEVSISDVAYVKYSGTMGNADITLEPELWFKAEAPIIFIRGSEEINVGGIHENTPLFSKNLVTGAINLKESVSKNGI